MCVSETKSRVDFCTRDEKVLYGPPKNGRFSGKGNTQHFKTVSFGIQEGEEEAGRSIASAQQVHATAVAAALRYARRPGLPSVRGD